tara:strand:+ start:640 stop:852 length:213 start_codon:yes stop_codon:yes gene_type:complete
MDNNESNKKNKTNKKRCEFCNKKKLLLTTCKCGKLFCIEHSNSFNHNCSYDYKKEKILHDTIEFQKIEVI